MFKTPTSDEIAKRLNLVDTEVAAQIVGLSRRTLEGLRVRGGGPVYIKFGRRIVYDVDDLINWAEENKRRSTCDCPGQLTNSPITSKQHG